jgi:uncharacterized membrane protein YgdD (TMEM256/DUF423 family)
MGTSFLAIGALLAALSVLAGAFGAHGLEARLEPASLELWETAARYLMYSGLGLILVGLAAERWARSGFEAAGWSLFIGALIFSGTVAALALGAPRWLGAVTPIGGVLMIAGFLLFAWTALKLS